MIQVLSNLSKVVLILNTSEFSQSSIKGVEDSYSLKMYTLLYKKRRRKRRRRIYLWDEERFTIKHQPKFRPQEILY